MFSLTYIILQSLIFSSGLMVAMSGNPMYAILFLILCFLNTSLLIGYLGNIFMCLLILIIYLGAIAILFIFIVMMINLKNEAINEGYSVLEMSFFFFLICFISLVLTYFFSSSYYNFSDSDINYLNFFMLKFDFINFASIQHYFLTPHLLGQVLFVQYFYPFLLSGIILLVAMVGAIVISSNLETSENILKQQVYVQLSRNQFNAVYKFR